MNKQRRKSLHQILDKIELLDGLDGEAAAKILSEVSGALENLADEEQEALDARPKSLMWSTTNDNMNENISDLLDVSANFGVLAERCEKDENHHYSKIKEEVIKAVNKIEQVIHR